MSGSCRTGFYVAIGLILLAISSAFVGCGDDSNKVSQHEQPIPNAGVDSSGGASLSSVAPNTFLTFEDAQYRLVAIEQANLVDGNAFEQIGIASDADIDQEDLRVFRKAGDDGAVYTLSPEGSGPAGSADGEDTTTQALWYRWAPEP